MIRLIWSRGRSTLSAFENLILALWRLGLWVQSLSLSHAEEARRNVSQWREASFRQQKHEADLGKRDLQPDGIISSFAQGTRHRTTHMDASLSLCYWPSVYMGSLPVFGWVGASSPLLSRFDQYCCTKGVQKKSLRLLAPVFSLVLSFFF